MLARLFPAGGNFWRLLCNKPETDRRWIETEHSPFYWGHGTHSLSGTATCPPISGQTCRWWSGKKEREDRVTYRPSGCSLSASNSNEIIQGHWSQYKRNMYKLFRGFFAPFHNLKVKFNVCCVWFFPLFFRKRGDRNLNWKLYHFPFCIHLIYLIGKRIIFKNSKNHSL